MQGASTWMFPVTSWSCRCCGTHVRRLLLSKQGAAPIKHGVCNVRHLGTRGHRFCRHGLQHLCGRDDGFLDGGSEHVQRDHRLSHTCARFAFLMMSFCAIGTSSSDSSTPKSPRATITPSVTCAIPSGEAGPQRKPNLYDGIEVLECLRLLDLGDDLWQSLSGLLPRLPELAQAKAE